MFNYIVVGAGLAGSVMAERIATQLNETVLVVDKRNQIAGNCFDEKDDNGIIIHKYGPHLFHTDNEDVWKYLSRFTSWRYYQHRVLAEIDGRKIVIPLNFNSIDDLFSKGVSEKLQESLLSRFQMNSRVSILELKRLQDPNIQLFTDFAYEKVFLNYTMKQWGLKPEQIQPQVTARVPIVIGRDDRYFQDKFQGVPILGYTKMIQNILKHRNIKLLLNTDFKEIAQVRNNHIYFLGKKFKGKIIYTGAIDELFDYKVGVLPYRSLRIDFHSLPQGLYQNTATVNYPNNYEFTRITEYKHIHPVSSDKTTISLEYPQQFEHEKNERFYPVFTEDSKRQYKRYFTYSKRFKNLHLLGRLAEYEYFDMDDVISRALKIFKETMI